jgi:hypothetical protein
MALHHPSVAMSVTLEVVLIRLRIPATTRGKQDP